MTDEEAYTMMLAQAKTILDYQQLLREAQWRIQDMLVGDDGQAWKEAEKWLEKLPEGVKSLV